MPNKEITPAQLLEMLERGREMGFVSGDWPEVSGTYSYLTTVANGGNVQNANGYDVIFTSDAGCATKLDHKVEGYTATTGAVNYWVRVPLLSHTAIRRFTCAMAMPQLPPISPTRTEFGTATSKRSTI